LILVTHFIQHISHFYTLFIKKKKDELIYKPDSVLNDYLSRQYVTILLKQPTRILSEQPKRIPIWFCFGVGFTLPRLLPDLR